MNDGPVNLPFGLDAQHSGSKTVAQSPRRGHPLKGDASSPSLLGPSVRTQLVHDPSAAEAHYASAGSSRAGSYGCLDFKTPEAVVSSLRASATIAIFFPRRRASRA